MIETKMVQTLKSKLVGLPIKIHKIESGSTEVGFPDWYIRTMCTDIWIEAKELKRWPVRESTKIIIPFGPGQFNWIMQHKKLHGKVMLIVTYKNEWYLFNDVRLDYTQREFQLLTLIPPQLNAISKYKLITILNSS